MKEPKSPKAPKASRELQEEISRAKLEGKMDKDTGVI